MNYSTIKKTIALSLVSLMAVGAANAQTTSSATSSTPKVFGGTDQYNTWSIGVNVGLPSPFLATGGSTGGFTDAWTKNVKFGYGVSLKDQLSHSVALQFDYNGGNVSGSKNSPDNSAGVTDVQDHHRFYAFNTHYNQFELGAVLNIVTLDFLRRKDAVNFYIKAAGGIISYTSAMVGAVTPGFATNNETFKAADGGPVTSGVVSGGTGVKFKVTNQLAVNLGYTENLIDDYNFTGVHVYPARSQYSYGYGGVEYTFGPASKPTLEWTNPVALMYDELYDEALRQEVAALKTRVGNVENAVRDLKKDSDGDGVSDQFDKCPNTPAGSTVDGSGCVIKFPAPIDTSVFMRKGVMYPGFGMNAPVASANAFANIQFEFDSSVLRTSSYPTLDATSSALRSSGSTVEVDGFASSEGTAAHNMKLSKDRANSVKTYLVNSGVDAKKVKVKGFGETHPIATNDTEDGRVLNRRVEFKK